MFLLHVSYTFLFMQIIEFRKSLDTVNTACDEVLSFYDANIQLCYSIFLWPHAFFLKKKSWLVGKKF